LTIEDNQIGYIALDASNLEPCGDIVRHLAAALHITRLYRRAVEGERSATQANQAKSRFLSVVSHELRTPLNVIVGLSELILQGSERRLPFETEDIQRIYASASHLSNLIRDVLDLASSDAGEIRLYMEKLNLVEALQPAVSLGKQLAQTKGLAWQVEIPDELPPVLGDRTRLRQILINLISNAVKFTLAGEVAVRVAYIHPMIEVSVRDTGLGIPPEDQLHIFDEFRQSERTAARGFGGMGLGLAISRHLVERHGGTLGVHSTGVEGEGATFVFRLPALLEEDDFLKRKASEENRSVVILSVAEEEAAQITELLHGEGIPAAEWLILPDEAWKGTPIMSR
jgi:signal transduction histidine kinase